MQRAGTTKRENVSVIDICSARAKLDRAIEHIENFEREAGTWLQSQPLRSRIERIDVLTDESYVEVVTPLPACLDTIFGDCVHNFRCVLDHVVMSLATANGADPEDSTIEFPVSSTYRAFYGYDPNEVRKRTPRWAGCNKIRKLDPEAQSFIEGLQPFRHVDASWVLTELQYLDNRDKHRRVISNYVEAVALLADPPGITTTYERRLRLSDGAHVATVKYAPGYSGPRVHPGIPAAISVDRSNGMGWHDAQGFLRGELLPHIRDNILAEAERRFA